MFFSHCVLLKLTLITCVVRKANADSIDKNEMEKIVTELEGNFNKKLNILESNLLDKLLNYTNGKVDETNKRIPELEEKMVQTLIASNKNLEDKLILALNASNEKITKNTVDALDNLKMELLEKIHIISSQLPCKEEALSRNNYSPPLYLMDKLTPSYVTLKRNSTGHLTYFKMLIAIQADEGITIKLSDKGDYKTLDNLYNINVGNKDTDTGGHQYTRLRRWSWKIKANNKGSWETLQSVYTPNSISATEFRVFYIKINDGKLEFGKEGDGKPIIIYYDDRFSSLKYYAFLYTGSEVQAKIRYDCPLIV